MWSDGIKYSTEQFKVQRFTQDYFILQPDFPKFLKFELNEN